MMAGEGDWRACFSAMVVTKLGELFKSESEKRRFTIPILGT
jgi:hypothetical protein